MDNPNGHRGNLTDTLAALVDAIAGPVIPEDAFTVYDVAASSEGRVTIDQARNALERRRMRGELDSAVVRGRKSGTVRKYWPASPA